MPHKKVLRPFCAYCYKTLDRRASKCGKCGTRTLCSRECQQADWRAGHRRWCGIAGEIGVDYEVREAPGKGLGVFALRRFDTGSKIMAERPLVLSPLEPIPEPSREAVAALLPQDGRLFEKFQRNGIGIDDVRVGESNRRRGGLFVSMSRVNHDCMGNSDHYFLDKHGVKILYIGSNLCTVDQVTGACLTLSHQISNARSYDLLHPVPCFRFLPRVASTTIRAGEEITFCYMGTYAGPAAFKQRRTDLRRAFDFVCNCRVCADSHLSGLFLEAEELNMIIARLPIHPGGHQGVKDALRAGMTLLRLYKQLKRSPQAYANIYYNMFQLFICKRSTLPQARVYIQKAVEAQTLFVGEDHPTVQRFKAFAKHPKHHQNYGTIHG